MSNKVPVMVVGNPEDGKYVDANFLKVYPAFFSSFLHQLKIDDGKARLVLWLMYKQSLNEVNSDSTVVAPTHEIMKAIQVTKPTALKYIADLIELNIISRKYPKMPIYTVDATLFYKGNLDIFFKKFVEDGR